MLCQAPNGGPHPFARDPLPPSAKPARLPLSDHYFPQRCLLMTVARTWSRVSDAREDTRTLRRFRTLMSVETLWPGGLAFAQVLRTRTQRSLVVASSCLAQTPEGAEHPLCPASMGSHGRCPPPPPPRTFPPFSAHLCVRRQARMSLLSR